MFCTKCGAQCAEGNAFCTACGTPIAQTQPEQPQVEQPQVEQTQPEQPQVEQSQAAPAAPVAAPNPQPTMQAPVYNPSASQQPVQQPMPQPMYAPQPQMQQPVYNPSASQQPIMYVQQPMPQPVPQPVQRPVYNAPTNTTNAAAAPKAAGSFFDRLKQDKLKMGLFFGSIGFVVLMIIGMIIVGSTSLIGTWVDDDGVFYVFRSNGRAYMYSEYGRDSADWEKDGEMFYLDGGSYTIERKGNYLYISDDDDDEEPVTILYRTSMRTDYSTFRELNKTVSRKELSKIEEKYDEWREEWREDSYVYGY